MWERPDFEERDESMCLIIKYQQAKKRKKKQNTQKKDNVDKYIVVENGTETKCVFSIGLLYNTTRK